MKRLILALMVSVALWGCGKSEPVLKGTTQEEFNQSVKKVVLALDNEEKQKEFTMALATLMMHDLAQAGSSSEENVKAFYKKLDNKTAAQVIEMAKNIKK